MSTFPPPPLCFGFLLWEIMKLDINLPLPFTSLTCIMWLEILSFYLQISTFNTTSKFFVFLMYSSRSPPPIVCVSCTTFTMSEHVDTVCYTESLMKSLSFNSASKSVFNARRPPFVALRCGVTLVPEGSLRSSWGGCFLSLCFTGVCSSLGRSVQRDRILGSWFLF